MRERGYMRAYLFSRLLIAVLLAAFIWWWYTVQFGRVFNPFNISHEAFEELSREADDS